jgi:ribosomal protein S18 acetylase RimI-like enzyme
MSADIAYRLNTASAEELAAHLSLCDADFVPRLSARVKIADYARKLASRAERLEAWADGALIGLAALYCDDSERRSAYLTSLSVLKKWARQGVAAELLRRCVDKARSAGMRELSLEAGRENVPAFRLYAKLGFRRGGANGEFVAMTLDLKSGENHER